MSVTKAEVRKFTGAVAQKGGDSAHFGKRWVDRFITRHPYITKKLLRKVEVIRKRFVKEKR